MPTLKENYEAIDAILRQNDEIFLQITESIANLEKKICECEAICIPILKAMREPEITHHVAKTENGTEYLQYEMKKTKRIELPGRGVELNKEKIQALLDEVSPTKLIVEEIICDSSVEITNIFVKISIG